MTDTPVNTHKIINKLKRETDDLREAWYQFAHEIHNNEYDADEDGRRMDRVETSIMRVARLVKILDTSEI